MKKKLISSLLAISMMITAVQPQITFAEDIEISSEQEETEQVEETESAEGTADEVVDEDEDLTEVTESAEIEEESEEEQVVEENIVEEQTLDEEGVPIQTYSETNGYGEEDGFQYRVLDDGTAEVTGYTGSENTKLEIPDSLNERKVTRIGDRAFIGKKFTGDLTIPSGIKEIGEYAFDECAFGGELRISNGVKIIGKSAFYGGNFTEDLVIPDSVEEIGQCAFEKCAFSGTLTLPSSLTTIAESTFADCGFTGGLEFPDSIEEIGDNAFSDNKFTGRLNLPDKIKKIGKEAFSQCGFTGELNLPDSIEEIGEYAFQYCDFNGSLKLSSKLKRIENGVFRWCSFTGDLVIPEGVEEIGVAAFEGRSINIESLDGDNSAVVYSSDTDGFPIQFSGKLILPDSIRVIKAYAFEYCGFTGELKLPKNLTSIGALAFQLNNFDGDLNIPENVQEIGMGAFLDCKFDGRLTLPTKLSKVEWETFFNCKFTGDLLIPDSVITVEEKAFSSEGAGQFNGKLKLSANLTAIGNEAFSNCKFTGDLQIPDKVTEIGAMAFSKSDYTGDIVIPDSIKKIGENAFYKAHNKNSIGKFVLPVLSSGVHRFLFEDRYTLECAQEVNAGQTIKATVIADGLSLDSPLITGWSSSNAQVASVDAKGNVSAHAKGTVTINAELYNGRSCEKQITVNPDKLTVRFDSAGGSAVATQTVRYKAKASAPADPTRKGYRFCGWYLNEQKYNFDTILVQDITLTAKWEKLNVKVSSVVLNKNYIKLKRNEKTSLSCDVKPKDATNASVVWTSTNPKVATVVNGQITAKSVGQTTIIAMAVDGSGVFATCNVAVGYTIKYQLNGGKNNGGNPGTVYQETVKLKNPTRSGYLFKGWYTDKKLKHKISKISSKNNKDLTVYAKWEKVKTGKTSISSLKGKKNGTTVLKWKSVSGAKGYEVSFATDKKFKNGCQIILTKSKSITLKKLQTKKTYYVRIRAYKLDSAGGRVYGKYSSVKSVKCK